MLLLGCFLLFTLLVECNCALTVAAIDDQVSKRLKLRQLSGRSPNQISRRKESGSIGGSTRGGFRVGGSSGSGSGIFKTVAGINTAFLVGSSLPPMNVPAGLGVNVPFPHVRLIGVGVLRYECQQGTFVNTASKAIMSDQTSGSRLAKYYFQNGTHVFDFTVAQGNKQAYVLGKQSASVASPVDPNVNVNWTRIDLEGDHFVNRVYELKTQGGQPKTINCTAESTVDVAYSAEYTFSLDF